MAFTVTETRRLADICSDCIVLILQLRASDAFGEAPVLRERIKELFDRIERVAKGAGYTRAEVQRALFALVAFIDETILTSDWSGKEAWATEPLQLELYDRNDAGEVFFNYLDQMLKAPRENADVLEVYYLCMALGFRGQYLIFQQHKLRALIEEAHAELQKLKVQPDESLAPHGKRRDDVAEVVKGQVPVWVFPAVAAAVGLLVYLVFRFMASGAAEQARGVIDAL